jgi:hypothetical protein
MLGIGYTIFLIRTGLNQILPQRHEGTKKITDSRWFCYYWDLLCCGTMTGWMMRKMIDAFSVRAYFTRIGKEHKAVGKDSGKRSHDQERRKGTLTERTSRVCTNYILLLL